MASATGGKNERFVFISYKRVDAARVEWIVDNLICAGHNVYIDRQMPTASYWQDELRNKINSCAAMMVVWSGAACTDGADIQIEREVAEAKRNSKPIIPVRIDPVDLPPYLNDLDFADLSGWQGNSGYSEWRSAVKALGPPLIGNAFIRAPTTCTRSWLRDAASVVENQKGNDEFVLRTYSREEFLRYKEIALRRGYEQLEVDDEVMCFVKQRKFCWPLAILLSICFILPVFIYISLYKKLPEKEVVKIVLIERKQT